MLTDIDENILKQTKLPISRNLFNTTPIRNTTGVAQNYDRFIPTRVNNNWETNFAIIPDTSRNTLAGKKTRESGESQRDSSAYTCLLRNELLGDNIEDTKTQCDDRQMSTPLKSRNLFKYGTPTKVSYLYCFSIVVTFSLSIDNFKVLSNIMLIST